MTHYDMEANSRQELLTNFKTAYGRSMTDIRGILSKFCPEMSEEEQQSFIYVFYPCMFGIYPYAKVTEKQAKAMEEAQVEERHEIYQTWQFGSDCIPFCTSSSSGIGRSGPNMEALAGTGKWLDGKRFGRNVSEADLRSWIDGLK